MKIIVGDTVGFFHDRMCDFRVTAIVGKTFSGVCINAGKGSVLVIGQEYSDIPRSKIITNITQGKWVKPR